MKALALVLLLGLAGCISIPTHEKHMKKCRDTAEELEQTRVRLAALEGSNSDLKKQLHEKGEEHEVLKTQMSSVRSTYDDLVQELKDDIASGEVGVAQNEKGLTITM